MTHTRHVIVKSTCETCPEKASECNHFCTLTRKWYETPPFCPLYWGICTKKNAAYASCPKYDAYASSSGSIWQGKKAASQSNVKKSTSREKWLKMACSKVLREPLKRRKLLKLSCSMPILQKITSPNFACQNERGFPRS